jgi:malonate transporter and related proteins
MVERRQHEMEIFVYVIFPVFGIMVLGAMAEKFRMLGPGTAIAINQYVTYFALPALLFTSMASVKIDTILNPNFIFAYTIGMCLTFALCFVIAKIALRENVAITTLQALSSAFSNASYMGIPILLLVLGHRAVVPATVVTILQFLLMVVSLIIINASISKNKKSIANIAKSALLTIVKNPIVISGILGILWSITGWHLPIPIYTLGHELGVTAGTCALFAIGKIMMSLKPKIELKEQTIISVFKLIIQPALTLPLFFLFHVEPFWAACGFVIAALPPVTLIYILAQQYHLHETNISGILLTSSLISIVTIPIALVLTIHFWPHLHYLKTQVAT